MAWVKAMLDDQPLVLGAHHVSRFPSVGPFRFRPVTANCRSASGIAEKRRTVWETGSLTSLGRPGLQRFHEAPPRRIRRPRRSAPANAPASPVTISPHIKDAVRQVLEAHGPLPKKLRVRERRALLRKLSAAAIKHLAVIARLDPSS